MLTTNKWKGDENSKNCLRNFHQTFEKGTKYSENVTRIAFTEYTINCSNGNF